MSAENFLRDCDILSVEQLEHMPTRQLLNLLRRTYRWGEYDWTIDDDAAKMEYQATIKRVLATREHIPNKKESKLLRKARIKKGK